MSYINDTSFDDINIELSEVTPLNSTLNEPLMNCSGTVRIEENTGILCFHTTSKIMPVSHEYFLSHYGGQFKTAVKQEASEKIDCKR